MIPFEETNFFERSNGKSGTGIPEFKNYKSRKRA